MSVCGYTGPGEAPGNVRAEAVSSTEISVQWNGLSTCRLVNGLIVKYRVQLKTCSLIETRDKELRDGEDWSSRGDILLTVLTPLTNYSIEVAAVNENGDVGPYSDPIIAVTHPCKVLLVDTKYLLLLFPAVTYSCECENTGLPSSTGIANGWCSDRYSRHRIFTVAFVFFCSYLQC